MGALCICRYALSRRPLNTYIRRACPEGTDRLAYIRQACPEDTDRLAVLQVLYSWGGGEKEGPVSHTCCHGADRCFQMPADQVHSESSTCVPLILPPPSPSISPFLGLAGLARAAHIFVQLGGSRRCIRSGKAPGEREIISE